MEHWHNLAQFKQVKIPNKKKTWQKNLKMTRMMLALSMSKSVCQWTKFIRLVPILSPLAVSVLIKMPKHIIRTLQRKVNKNKLNNQRRQKLMLLHSNRNSKQCLRSRRNHRHRSKVCQVIHLLMQFWAHSNSLLENHLVLILVNLSKWCQALQLPKP